MDGQSVSGRYSYISERTLTLSITYEFKFKNVKLFRGIAKKLHVESQKGALCKCLRGYFQPSVKFVRCQNPLRNSPEGTATLKKMYFIEEGLSTLSDYKQRAVNTLLGNYRGYWITYRYIFNKVTVSPGIKPDGIVFPSQNNNIVLCLFGVLQAMWEF
jgi:hypothetical protein